MTDQLVWRIVEEGRWALCGTPVEVASRNHGEWAVEYEGFEVAVMDRLALAMMHGADIYRTIHPRKEG